ncbi:MAG TPA: GDP-mannose 4,6-dehydratase [Casimicrobiaceae bacterium]|nr:GDP-mannose 4,6-dehydratase [Casimicrobiaceae bacterium]
MKRLLVTGRHGFVGSVIANLIERDSSLGSWQLSVLPQDFDLCNADQVRTVVNEASPDAVLHLAAQTWVPEAIRDPESTLKINVIGTLHLLQALRQDSFGGPLVFASTGDVYGLVTPDELPVGETRLAAPRNAYAVSKLAAEALCYQWMVTDEMRVVIARPFNHIGAGQSERFVISDFARQVAEIKLGRREAVVYVGDIDVTRDFTDVRDVVQAYFALLRDGEPGEIYNVCSGEERTIRSLLQSLALLAGVEVRIEQDASRLRKSEQRRMRGDPSKVRRATGWSASTSLDESLDAMLRYWEREITSG